MALIAYTDLQEWFDISRDFSAGRFLLHIGAASRRLKAWVGADAYADAALATPTDKDRADDLRVAEAHLAMHFAILGLNTVLRPTGIVKTEKVEGDAVLTHLSPNETAQLATLYLDQAEALARPYMLEDGTPDAPFEISESEEEDA